MANREVSYTMQRGMVDYFMNLLNLPRGEVWAAIKDACYTCVDRLDNNNKAKSWCYADIPGSNVKLRIDVHRLRKWNPNARRHESGNSYRCEVKFSNVSSDEHFTDTQVEDYIVEKILLQAED